ncbi:unnamed protein product [Allacma fusca]|uniref:Uncharacterized protein n=1 Tax=Allacma fusca TaxID=39272 RepID=A0A8J2JCD0_9HEXA|nr:unnamed protein product [Allacma fusca]
MELCNVEMPKRFSVSISCVLPSFCPVLNSPHLETNQSWKYLTCLKHPTIRIINNFRKIQFLIPVRRPDLEI